MNARGNHGREMNAMTSRLRRCAALTLSCLLALSACSGGAQTAPEGAQLALPEPPEQEERQVLGDARAPYTRELTLYYAVEDSLDLTSVTRAIEVAQNETLAENTLLELLRILSGTGALRPASPANQLIDLEISCGIATVNLSLEAGVRQGDQDGLLLCAAIANTLLGLEGIDAVNLLVGGRSEAVCALPMGALDAPIDNLSALYAQLQSEQSRLLADPAAAIKRSAPLYFPSSDGKYLLPELRELSFTGGDFAAAILDALKAGPMVRACCFSAMPGNQELLSGAPEVWISPSGERVIDVNFSEMLPNYLAFAGVEAWQLYGSVVLSLCSFVPELDAVRICVDGAPVTECALGSGTLHFQDGLMRRGDFSARIGGAAALYFANPDGGLRRAERAMSRAAAASPKRILAEMILAGSPGGGLESVFPEGIVPEDILGVEVAGGVALVNLSGNFYSRCQMLDGAGERRLVYAMIDALAELPDIGAVRFVVEGMSVDTLVEDIYLRTTLLPDPGLVAEDAGSGAEGVEGTP